jgi:co-chaperonin GroES (HSP10)
MTKIKEFNFIPYGRNIVVEIPDSEKIKDAGLIAPTSQEMARLGVTSKTSDISNAADYEQHSYKVVSVGPKCEEVKVGDTILFKPAVQTTLIVVDEVEYCLVEEFWVAGMIPHPSKVKKHESLTA